MPKKRARSQNLHVPWRDDSRWRRLFSGNAWLMARRRLSTAAFARAPTGGANRGSSSYDATRGLLFVAANRLATAVRLIPRAAYDAANHGETGSVGAMARRTFLDPEGRPCNKEPWGALAAIDVAPGKVRWASSSSGAPCLKQNYALMQPTMGASFGKRICPSRPIRCRARMYGPAGATSWFAPAAMAWQGGWQQTGRRGELDGGVR